MRPPRVHQGRLHRGLQLQGKLRLRIEGDLSLQPGIHTLGWVTKTFWVHLIGKSSLVLECFFYLAPPDSAAWPVGISPRSGHAVTDLRKLFSTKKYPINLKQQYRSWRAVRAPKSTQKWQALPKFCTKRKWTSYLAFVPHSTALQVLSHPTRGLPSYP